MVQSRAGSWPVLTPLAKGRLRVRVLLALEPLKMLPAVPVASVVTTLLPRLMVVDVPIRTCWPPMMERLLPTVRLPSVVVPMPPFAADKMPVTSPVERLTAVEDSRPEEFECRMPALNAEIVGAWETVRLVMVVVARVLAPLTVKVPETI